ncbi:AraD1 family protein [Xylophilus sp.]|uniref:AraD1 family protein n=1 Tax=Xylophilus sp. TaxID=2653893 RepID=UPI0013B898D7|nr:AraD1 family protein [Xylophilus sp.]KAF1044076.1 MAG: hypothetical protein GAK38_03695 [Xylophilus sp.]
MRLIQFLMDDGSRRVGVVEEGGARVAPVAGIDSVHALAQRAAREGATLARAIAAHGTLAPVDYAPLAAQQRLLPPVDHSDPAHLLVTGTGLTHLGSADARDRMHRSTQASEAELTDSMRMFRWGIEGGRPAPGAVGVQPEWFYKGDGGIVVPPGHPLPSPDFAEDAGEEPEIVGIYLIGPDRTPLRLGFALANEFSDHAMERRNYLYLSHSKLRFCSFGPELLLGALPGHVEGTSRIRRGGEVVWQRPFVSGEANMTHTLENLEYHHFKYPQFLRPGDVHVHFFGTATVSFTDGFRTESGDLMEIEVPAFGRPLVNAIGRQEGGAAPGAVRAL